MLNLAQCQKSESSYRTSFSMLHISNASQIFKISAFSKISRLVGIFSIPSTPSSSSLPTLPTFPNFQYFQCYRYPVFIYCTHNALKTLPLPIFLRSSIMVQIRSCLLESNNQPQLHERGASPAFTVYFAVGTQLQSTSVFTTAMYQMFLFLPQNSYFKLSSLMLSYQDVGL